MICHKVLVHLAFSIDLFTMITGYTGKGGHNGMQTQDSLNFGRVGAVVKLAKKEKEKKKRNQLIFVKYKNSVCKALVHSSGLKSINWGGGGSGGLER